MAKTAKKPAKTKAKSAAAKSSAKKTVAKKTNVKVTKNTKLDKSVTAAKLYKFNLFAAASYVVFAILSVVLLSKETVSVVLTHATKDELASSSTIVLGSALKTLVTVELRYSLAALFIISAIFSLLLATRLRKQYEAGIKNATSGLRWIFMGITLGLVLEIITLLAEVQDAMTLKMVTGLVVVTTVLAWLAERENKNTKKKYAIFNLSIFTGVLAWFPLVGSLVGTSIFGITNFGWHVYVLSAVVLTGFLTICLTQYKRIRDGVNAQGYLQNEGKYVSTDFLIKLAVFGIILVALYK